MKLKTLLRDSTDKQRVQLAKDAGTSVAYLYQLAGGHRMPGVKLAKRIELATEGKITKQTLRPDIWRVD